MRTTPCSRSSSVTGNASLPCSWPGLPTEQDPLIRRSGCPSGCPGSRRTAAAAAVETFLLPFAVRRLIERGASGWKTAGGGAGGNRTDKHIPPACVAGMSEKANPQ